MSEATAEPVQLRTSTRVKALSEIMDMLNVWDAADLRELAQELIYRKLTSGSDADITATHQVFVDKTNAMIAARAQVEAEEQGEEDDNSVIEGECDDGSEDDEGTPEQA